MGGIEHVWWQACLTICRALQHTHAPLRLCGCSGAEVTNTIRQAHTDAVGVLCTERHVQRDAAGVLCTVRRAQRDAVGVLCTERHAQRDAAGVLCTARRAQRDAVGVLCTSRVVPVNGSVSEGKCQSREVPPGTPVRTRLRPVGVCLHNSAQRAPRPTWFCMLSVCSMHARQNTWAHAVMTGLSNGSMHTGHSSSPSRTTCAVRTTWCVPAL